MSYSLYELTTLLVIQLAGSFIFFSAIRWLSALLYDRIREVMMLSEDVKIYKELLSTMVTKLQPPLNDISVSAKRLSSTHLSPSQMELVSTMRVSVENALNKLNRINNASDYQIRPIEEEDVVFNLYNLVSATLMTYGSNKHCIEKKHQLYLSSEVPQRVMGNSLLTKQILHSIFNALEGNVALKEKALDVYLVLCDTNVQNIMINFKISIQADIVIDSRDLSNLDDKLTSQLNLDDAKRLIDATDSNFAIQYQDGTLDIEFTQSYKDIDAIVVPDIDLVKAHDEGADVIAEARLKKINMHLSLSDAAVLIISLNGNKSIEDGVSERVLYDTIQPYVRKVEIEASTRSFLKRFENAQYDMVLLSVFLIGEMSGLQLVRKIRDIESGIGTTHTVILSLDAMPLSDAQKVEAMEAGVDGFCVYPKDVDKLPEILKRYFNGK
ncbi:MAG: response regulator [Marinilabiliaceae bacterium]|nr:response regulator [Marinilabiliaceae bacterium]